MKIDLSDAERNFASFSAGLNTFVMNTFATYDQQIQLLTETITKLREENSKLQKDLENKESSENKDN